MGCDWNGNDFSNLKTGGEDCGPLCERTPECSHFTWTDYNGGTCWMKKGKVKKSDAITSNSYFVCGIKSSKKIYIY